MNEVQTRTKYSYDALNRLTKKSYSDSTPLVRYLYDGDTPVNGQQDCTVTVSLTVTNGIGRRTGMCDAAGGEAWSYNEVGQVLTDRRTTNSVTKDITYAYYLGGPLNTITYPSGRVITYTYSNALRLLTAKDITNSINYAEGSCSNGACYAPQGALSSLLLGKVDGGFGGITDSYSYNNRLQPSAISATSSNGTVLDLSYGYGGSNDGNVASITNNLVNNRSQTYTYDYLNRILTAQSSVSTGADCWGQSYSYDATYNTNLATITKTKTDQSCTNQIGLSVSISAKNRINTSGYAYDNAGNLTNDGAGDTYSWNAENQLTSTAGVNYTYDGDGQRAKKDNGKLYWYGPGGQVLLETALNGDLLREFIYFGGAQIARRESDGTIYYFFADHLGTNRVMTSATGTTVQESTYYPFGGEQRQITTTAENRWKFTGLERDNESGLDHTLFRKFASNLGRWLSPDPLAGDITNPQSLNRYSYVLNNPTNATDPTGLRCVWEDGTFDSEDDPQTGSPTHCDDAGGIWYAPGTYAAEYDWASMDEDGTLVLHGGPTESITVTATEGSILLVGSDFSGIGITPPNDGMTPTLPCSVGVSCTAVKGLDVVSHCGITVGQNGSYTQYDGEPSTPYWLQILNPLSDQPKLIVQSSPGSATPGGNVVFQSPVSCSTVGCIQTVTSYFNSAQWTYSALFLNSNTYASATTNACGLSVSYPRNAIGAK